MRQMDFEEQKSYGEGVIEGRKQAEQTLADKEDRIKDLEYLSQRLVKERDEAKKIILEKDKIIEQLKFINKEYLSQNKQLVETTEKLQRVERQFELLRQLIREELDRMDWECESNYEGVLALIESAKNGELR